MTNDERLKEIRRLGELADEEAREAGMVRAIIITLVGRLIDIVPGAREDPLIKLATQALDKSTPERQQLIAIAIARASAEKKEGEA